MGPLPLTALTSSLGPRDDENERGVIENKAPDWEFGFWVEADLELLRIIRST